MSSPTLTGSAAAKVNLFLHVGPLDPEGFHPVASLATFADLGDRVSVTPGPFGLTVEGPFAEGVPADESNLILRALLTLGKATGIGRPELAVTLDKRLPVASGLGGGSSDAGAALRLARQALHLNINDDALAEIALCVGSDGPMCLFPRTVWAQGRGELLTPEPRLPALPALLVNPAVPSPTGGVYRAYDAGPPSAADLPAPPADWSADGVIGWLSEQRNDLEAPAVALSPVIGTVNEVVSALPGARLTRMSGSGATVYSLFETLDAARSAEDRIRTDYGDWWAAATVLGAAVSEIIE